MLYKVGTKIQRVTSPEGRTGVTVKVDQDNPNGPYSIEWDCYMGHIVQGFPPYEIKLRED